MKGKNTKDHYRGCLLGGAIGDALGRSVQFLKQKEINNRLNSEGIDMIFNNQSNNETITAETQMMLFTAEGILRAESRGTERGVVHIPSVVYFAYQRWLTTQGHSVPEDKKWILNGWMLTIKDLHVQRDPVQKCISVLVNNQNGLSEEEVNDDNQGCCGVTRGAPIGLFHNRRDAFTIAVDCAALTQAHPSDCESAGIFAYLIAVIVEGHDLDKAVLEAIERCYSSNKVLLTKAYQLAKSDKKVIDVIKQLDEGRVDEEALAIAIYCALKYKNDFIMCVKTAIGHDRDKSIGSIAGNILGAYLGVSRIPDKLINQVEINDVITQVADDLLTRYRDDDEWWARYPGS